MKIGRIFTGMRRSLEIRRIEKAQKEIERHIQVPNLWEIPETAVPLMSQVQRNKAKLGDIAKKEGVVIRMTVREDSANKVPQLDISMSEFSKKKTGALRKTPVRTLDIEDSQPLIYSRPNHRMLENSDGVNYLAGGEISTEDGFLSRVYRTIDFLMKDLGKSFLK